MILWLILILLFLFNLIFMFMKHPLAMGLILLIQTTLISMSTGFITKSFWFSYILFIVFLGGMLVLFIYITSLASNEMFSLSMKLFLNSIILFMMNLFIIYFMDKNLLFQFINLETLSFNNYKSYMMENSLTLNKMYNYPTNLISIMLMIYLLITLIIVVKITNLSKGPLRPMFN